MWLIEAGSGVVGLCCEKLFFGVGWADSGWFLGAEGMSGCGLRSVGLGLWAFSMLLWVTLLVGRRCGGLWWVREVLCCFVCMCAMDFGFRNQKRRRGL